MSNVINMLRVGDTVYNIAASDGKANPESFLLEVQGIVTEVVDGITTHIRFGSMFVFNHMEDQFLKPNSEGFCYYFRGFDGIENYRVYENFYRVPTDKLISHMSTYVSPWK